MNWNFSGRLEFVQHSNSVVVDFETWLRGALHMCPRKHAYVCGLFFFNTAIWQTSCATSMFVEACVLKSCLEHVALVVWGIGDRRQVRLMKTRKKFVVQWDGHSQKKVILESSSKHRSVLQSLRKYPCY